jgi:hypothetical protein
MLRHILAAMLFVAGTTFSHAQLSLPSSFHATTIHSPEGADMETDSTDQSSRLFLTAASTRNLRPGIISPRLAMIQSWCRSRATGHRRQTMSSVTSTPAVPRSRNKPWAGTEKA